jgi:hypothetical protein
MRGVTGGAGSGDDDEEAAGHVQKAEPLVQDDRPHEGREGRLEGHQRGEGRLRQAPQDGGLQGEGERRHQRGQTQRLYGRARSEMPERCDASPRRQEQGGDRHRERHAVQPGHAPADPDRQQDARRPGRRRGGGQREADDGHRPVPRLGESQDAGQGDGDPDQAAPAAPADRDGQRPEELDRDRGAQRQMVQGSQEAQTEDGRGQPERCDGPPLMRCRRPDPGPDQHEQEHGAERGPQPGGAGRPGGGDQRDRPRVAELHAHHRDHGQRDRSRRGEAAAGGGRRWHGGDSRVEDAGDSAGWTQSRP